MKFTKRHILIVSAAAAGLLLLSGITWYEVSLRPPNASDHSAVSFELPKGEKSTETASRLEKAQLIRDEHAFLIFIIIHGIRAKLQAGSYSLSPSHSASDVAAILSQGKISTNLLIIPEGKNLSQIIKLAEAKGIQSADMKAALAKQYGYSFLKGAPGLEGYLFPDSYQVNKKTTASDLVNDMLANFAQKVPAKFTPLFKRQGLSLHDGLILASMIEKEVNTAADRPKVAQVFLRRLRIGMALESDTTVEYAAAQLGLAFSIDLDSPYNTYSHTGLPPGPISNPGLSALQAVANPAKTNYLYFVTGRDGKTRFAVTFSQHQANIARYGLISR